MSKTLFMETTEIPPEKTVAEIQTVLVAYGASALLTEFEAGAVTAVSFKHRVNGTDMPFRLPCRWQAIAEILRKRARVSDYAWKSTYDSDLKRRQMYELKARRVAWRQILRWVQAQMALVETEMVSVEEVFFQYLQVKSGRTFFEHFKEKQFQLDYKEPES